MQGLWLTLVFGLLLPGCANEKFRDQVEQTRTQAVDAAGTSADQPTEKDAAEATASMPADVTESTADGESSPMPKPIFADCETTPDRPIVGDLYQLHPDTKALPDFKKMKAIKKICLSQLDIKTRNFSEGFPGVEKLFEWFALDMRFAVNVPRSGKWEFKLVADDGAILYLDQDKLVDNDGQHETREKTGRSNLSAGVHNFRVSYFQGPRYNIALELYWKGPQDTEFTYIPATSMIRPDASLASGME
ncbi:MAG TPA: PA14 domain-containing protein [Oligoflexus sp.]|uniref:PA14 domain-containing protein n=1 Tax=Oligoflexus sp. TaxID=1971216 RepID=UPI002D7FA6D9|nr:PA14 domain-containing protein [Oligoflexus sp.]HET9240818.1 PA14 domain-containing protein [Oligoflexus sp.]